MDSMGNQTTTSIEVENLDSKKANFRRDPRGVP